MCQDRDILSHRYDSELLVFADAVSTLETAIESDLATAIQRADRAFLAFEHAREQVNDHIRWHHCRGLDFYVRDHS